MNKSQCKDLFVTVILLSNFGLWTTKKALSNAQRQKRFREKEKTKFGAKLVLEKDSSRKKQARKANIERARQDERESQKRSREKKKVILFWWKLQSRSLQHFCLLR